MELLVDSWICNTNIRSSSSNKISGSGFWKKICMISAPLEVEFSSYLSSASRICETVSRTRVAAIFSFEKKIYVYIIRFIREKGLVAAAVRSCLRLSELGRESSSERPPVGLPVVILGPRPPFLSGVHSFVFPLQHGVPLCFYCAKAVSDATVTFEIGLFAVDS